MFGKYKKSLIILLISLMSFFYGCASSPIVSPPAITGVPGIYHTVKRGQTLWSISKIYNVDLDEIVRINRIPDSSKIEINQLIFIPQEKKSVSLPKRITTEDFIWPVKGRVKSTFSQTTNNMINKGIDIIPYSDSNVYAARSGKVVFCSSGFKGFGKTIIIEHSDGFLSVYSRNSKVYVKLGDYVQQGEVIGIAGSAGRDKEKYLHFEIRKGHLPQNPYFYLP